jgi:phosphoribosylformylglycinamidine synthase
MVGLIDDIVHITRATFQHDGDAILLLGEMGGELGGSEYLATVHGQVLGAPPRCDVKREKMVIDVLLDAIRSGVVSSAHDCSDGGIAVALAECCIANIEAQSGAEVDLSRWGQVPDRAILFGESQGRVVLSSNAPERVIAIAAAAGVPCVEIGRVRRDSNALEIKSAKGSLRSPLARMRRAYHDTIPAIMSRTPEHATFDELTPVAAH